MHILEQYALSCGVKIDRPYIYDKYYPVPFKKYIALQASSGMDSKNYSYFLEVINMIKPYLDKEEISIVQVGGPQDKAIEGVYSILDSSINQMAYLIKNSLMYFGNDSCCLHFASYYNKKSVTVSGVLYDQNFYPYWSDEKDYKILSPKTHIKPSFSAQENPKRINMIKPEEVARSVLDFLKIKHDLTSEKTLYIGPSYLFPCLEVVPNFINEQFNGKLVNVRLDLNFDEDVLMEWGRRSFINIITDKEVNPNFLRAISRNVKMINYEVGENTRPEYIEELKSFIEQVNLFSRDEVTIGRSRANLIDWDIVLFKDKEKKDIDNFEEICDTTRYKSSKVFMSENKQYPSYAAFEAGVDSDTVIDSKSFWRDADFFRIYNK